MWWKLSLRARLNTLLAIVLLLGLTVNIGWLLFDAAPRVRAEDQSVVRLARQFIETSLAGLDEAADPDARLNRIVDDLNGYLTIQEPWSLAKDPSARERLGTVLYTAADGLRALAVLLSPVIPVAAARLWEALGAEESLGRLEAQPIREAGDWGRLPAGTRVGEITALFPRIDAEVVPA